MVDLMEFLNRRVYWEALRACWAKPFVDAATEVLADHDLLSLIAPPMPARRDEYEPEAVHLVARLLGFPGMDALWASSPRPLRSPTPAAAQAACAEAFAELFGERYRSFVGAGLGVDLAEALASVELRAAPAAGPGPPRPAAPVPGAPPW